MGSFPRGWKSLDELLTTGFTARWLRRYIVTMDIRSIIRPLVPPVLYDVARLLKPAHRTPFGYEPRETFAEAVRDAGEGYEAANLFSAFHDARADLTSGIPDFTAPLFASVAAASIKAAGRKIRVLDFGGGSGYLRSYVNTFFDSRIKTDWLIVETPGQVRFAGNLGRDDVRYSLDIGQNNFDLAMFSGSLQYLDDWRSPLLSVDADMIYIGRTPLGVHEQPFVQRTLREGQHVTLAGRVIARQDLFSLLEATYSLGALWNLESHLFELGVCAAPSMLWERKS